MTHIWHIYVKEYRKLTQNIYVRIYVRTVFHICFIWATCMCSIYEPSCLIYVRYVNPIELHICILYEYMWWHICHISTYKLNIWNVSLLVYFLYEHIRSYMSIYILICPYMNMYVVAYRKLTQNIYVRIYVQIVFHICFMWTTCMCSIYVSYMLDMWTPLNCIYVSYMNICDDIYVI